MTKAEQETMLANLRQYYETTSQTTQENLDKIQSIMQTASDEKRALTAEELAEI